MISGEARETNEVFKMTSLSATNETMLSRLCSRRDLLKNGQKLWGRSKTLGSYKLAKLLEPIDLSARMCRLY